MTACALGLRCQHGMPHIHMERIASWFLLTMGCLGDISGRFARACSRSVCAEGPGTSATRAETELTRERRACCVLFFCLAGKATARKRHSGSERQRPTARQHPAGWQGRHLHVFAVKARAAARRTVRRRMLVHMHWPCRSRQFRMRFAGGPTVYATRGEARRALAHESARRHNVTTADHIARSRHRHWVSSAPAPLPPPFGSARTAFALCVCVKADCDNGHGGGRVDGGLIKIVWGLC